MSNSEEMNNEFGLNGCSELGSGRRFHPDTDRFHGASSMEWKMGPWDSIVRLYKKVYGRLGEKGPDVYLGR